MPRRVDRTNAAGDLATGLDRLQPIADALKTPLRPWHEINSISRHPRGDIGRVPEGQFRIRYEIVCIWEGKFIEIIKHAPEVIGMRVGDHDLPDCFWIDANGLDGVDQLAQGRHESSSTTDVDQDQLRWRADESDIGWW